jgi:hypothetical protein
MCSRDYYSLYGSNAALAYLTAEQRNIFCQAKLGDHVGISWGFPRLAVLKNQPGGVGLDLRGL